MSRWKIAALKLPRPMAMSAHGSHALPPLLPLINGVPFAGLGGPLFNAMLGTKFDQYSVFGNATWSVTPTIDLTAGLRYASSTQKYHQDYEQSVLVGTPALIDQKADSNKTSYLLSAKWKPAADTSVYGSVATGYRVGGPSALPPGILADGHTPSIPTRSPASNSASSRASAAS